MTPMDYHRPTDDDLPPITDSELRAATARTSDVPTLAAIEQQVDAGRTLRPAQAQYLLHQLRAVTALVDEWIARVGHMRERAEHAERQVADVRALHRPDGGIDGPSAICVECTDYFGTRMEDPKPYPCPTIRALDSAQPQDTPAVVRRTPTEPNRTTLPAQPQDTPNGDGDTPTPRG